MTPRFDDVWRENPELHAILQESPTLGSARKRVFDYLNQRQLVFLNHDLGRPGHIVTPFAHCGYD